MNLRKYLIFDIGGTFIKWSLVNEKFQILDSNKFALNEEKDAYLMFEQIGIVIKDINKNNDIVAIGVATAGTVNPVDSVILGKNANIKNYGGVNIKEQIAKYFKGLVIVENDANAATIGEIRVQDIKISNALMMTIGTDIGGGIIINDNLYHGSYFMAGEIGFQIVRNNLRWGEHFSTIGLINMIKNNCKINLEAKDILNSSDPNIQFYLDDWYKGLANGIANLIASFNFGLIIIGGGISESPDFDLVRIKKYINQFLSLPQFISSYQLVKAQLGNQAAILGMTYLINQSLKT